MTKSIQTVFGASLPTLETVKTTVEIAVEKGIGIHLIGLPDSATKESILRVFSALLFCGYSLPGKKIIINVSPSDLRKDFWGRLDLCIALGVLAAAGRERLPSLNRFIVAGELGSDGSVRPVRGALGIALLAARESNIDGVILPADNAAEASVIADRVKVYGVKTLADAVRVLSCGDDADEFLIGNMDGC